MGDYWLLLHTDNRTAATESQSSSYKTDFFFPSCCGGMQNDMRKIASHSLVLSQTHTHTDVYCMRES